MGETLLLAAENPLHPDDTINTSPEQRNVLALSKWDEIHIHDVLREVDSIKVQILNTWGKGVFRVNNYEFSFSLTKDGRLRINETGETIINFVPDEMKGKFTNFDENILLEA